VCVALVVGALLVWSTRQADIIERERQAGLASFVLMQAVAKVGYEQEASTVWDEAIIQVHAPDLDLEWIDNNLGIWMHDYYGHDQTYVLNTSHEPIYAMRGGKRMHPSSFRPIASSIRKLATELRARLNSGEAEPTEGGQSSGLTELLTLEGRPSIVSIKPIVSDTGKMTPVPGSEYFHVAIRHLDGTLMPILERDYWLRGGHFAFDRPTGKNWTSIPLNSRNGTTIGYFVWEPFRPGEKVGSRMIPALVVALLLVTLITAWLLLRIRRSTAELEASEAQAHHLAFHDQLTGLPNRALFNERCDHALKRLRRGEALAVLLLDLDRFKHVNDSFGHPAGDALIRELGGRLAGVFRGQDLVARLGGDEFGVLAINVRSQEDVAELCERILAAVGEPFDALGNQAFVGVSIGAVIAPFAGVERLDLIRKADIALYRAKNDGRNRYCFFTSAMDEGVRFRGMVEEELRSALSNGEGLRIYYQPQTSAANGKIIGFEALIRWEHPTRGLISPEQFIPVAEDTGLVSSLGDWVLREACRFSRNRPDLYVAVNISPVQFRQPSFAEHVIGIIRGCGADPRRVEIEITEGALLGDEELVRATLGQLRLAGIKIVLDDFGTGYSSLRYLRHFNVDKIKIDRSFVQHLGYQIDSAAIVTAVVTLGHAMGLTVTAEGVETSDQRRLLASIGCDELQGFLFSRAVPEEEVDRLLVGNRQAGLAA
jgi:diguanylate cyclase (GGDEF)-like protein